MEQSTVIMDPAFPVDRETYFTGSEIWPISSEAQFKVRKSFSKMKGSILFFKENLLFPFFERWGLGQGYQI